MSRTNLVNNFVIVSPSEPEINQRAAILTARKLIHVKFQFLAAGFNKTETLTPTFSGFGIEGLDYRNGTLLNHLIFQRYEISKLGIHIKFQFLAAGFNKTETLTPTLSGFEI